MALVHAQMGGEGNFGRKVIAKHLLLLSSSSSWCHKELDKLTKFKSDFTYVVFNIAFLSGKWDFDNA
jgi:hypothetical protein